MNETTQNTDKKETVLDLSRWGWEIDDGKETPKPKGQPLFKDNAIMIELLRDVWSSGK